MCSGNGHIVPPKGPCLDERIADDVRGNDDDGGDGGGVEGGRRQNDEVVDLREVDCCVVGIKCEENGHVLPPALPHDSTRYLTIEVGRRGDKGDKEDVSGLVPILVNETGSQHIGGTSNELISAPCGECEHGIIGAHICPG